MVAGEVAMSLMTRDRFDFIAELGNRARISLSDALKVAGVRGRITGDGSLFYIHLTNRELTDYRSSYRTPVDRKRVSILVERLLEKGFILATTAMGCTSTAMTHSDIDALTDACTRVLREMQREGIFDERWIGQ
jgi:glutamate-1-semialdehyde 2,1-aminomutase